MMFAALRARQPGKPLRDILWWYFLHSFCFAWVGPLYRYRAWGAANVPRDGPVLLVSNHQSFLDPILVGLACHHRQFFALARATLFDHLVFAWLIRSLNAIPLRQGGSDKTAMRQCVCTLQQSHALLVFPEGARTLDGKTQPFSPGTMLLIKRARPQVVPVAIEGAFKAWPRTRRVPRPAGQIWVQFGQPVDAESLVGQGAHAALEQLRRQVESMRLELAGRMTRLHHS